MNRKCWPNSMPILLCQQPALNYKSYSKKNQNKYTIMAIFFSNWRILILDFFRNILLKWFVNPSAFWCFLWGSKSRLKILVIWEELKFRAVPANSSQPNTSNKPVKALFSENMLRADTLEWHRNPFRPSVNSSDKIRLPFHKFTFSILK